MDAVELGDHMEFDPELLIHLHRRGVPVRSVPTRVIYATAGLSHFDPVRDNVRMTRLYTRSLLQALGVVSERPRRRSASDGGKPR